MWRSAWRVLILVTLACLPFAASGSPVPAAALQSPTQSPWQKLADTLFLPVVPVLGPSPSVSQNVIMQDAAGFIWTGGKTGLARWDGYRFRIYNQSGTPQDGLPDHWVRALHCDSRGRLWVGLQSGELAVYDPQTDHFSPVKLAGATDSVGPIIAIRADAQAGLWVATDKALFHLDKGDHASLAIRTVSRPNGESGATLAAMLRARDGTLWAGGDAGLFWSGPNPSSSAPTMGWAPSLRTFPLPVADGTRPQITCLFEDAAGRIWAGTQRHGAFIIAADHKVSAPVTLSRIEDTPGTGRAITSIVEIRPGVTWLGTDGYGIFEVEEAAGSLAPEQVRQILRDPARPNSLDSNLIYAMFRDRAGSLWVGTPAGLSETNWASPGIGSMFGGHGAGAGIAVEDVTAILVRPDGSIWLGSQNEGIDILEPSGMRTASLSTHGERVFAMATAGENGVLVGTAGGLYIATGQTRQLTRVVLKGRDAASGVRAITPIGADIWIGGFHDGVWRLHLDAAGGLTVTAHVAASQLANPSVHVIAPTADGHLIIGTRVGFDLLDPATGNIEHVLHDPADPGGLHEGAVVSALTDRYGRAWIGTNNSGIDIMTGRDKAGRPRFLHLGTQEGLPNLDINIMLTGPRGRVWASTDTGIVVIDPATFAIHAFGAADGVMNAPFWVASGATTANGDLLFGGLDGMSVVTPSAADEVVTTQPVVVTGISFDGEPMPLQDVSSASASDDGRTITVPTAIGTVAIEFAMLDYVNAKNALYRYRLDDFDKDWVFGDATHRVATYTKLLPGNYTLHISGSDREGKWTGNDMKLYLHVLPAWYQTPWARASETILVILAMAGMVQARTALLRRRQRELEQQVAQRTAELTASQEELHQLAYFDGLTALPNRRSFNEEFARVLKSHADSKEVFALVTLDLDGFKHVNDTLGHDAGDEMLVVAGARIRDAVRQDDFVARLGGDEFAILLTPVNQRAVIDLVCQRIVSNMAEPVKIKSGLAKIGASAGVALFPRDGTSQEMLYKNADLALYAAKQAGRGAWRWYADTQTQKA